MMPPASRAASTELIEALQAARREEKSQTLFYRALAASAEEAGDAATAERINGLLADEQHHLSRITARLLELGHPARDSTDARFHPGLDAWEVEARRRERLEVERYEAMIELDADEKTRSMIESFLEAERRHAVELGGKWMSA